MSTILIADDEFSTRQYLTAALEKTGHQVTACTNGLQAFSVFESAPTRFDLLLTDIVMPGMDGMELSSRIKAIRPDMKIVFMTGFAGMAPEGSTKVIAKPFHLGNLTREIDEILRG